MRTRLRTLAILLVIAVAQMAGTATDGASSRATPAQQATKFGIFYLLWHCLALSRTQGKPHNISRALSGEQPWGPIPELHFWGEPQVGYYCLTDRPDILRLHAIMLRDAGIDFVFIDATNNEYSDARSEWSPAGIVAPLLRLLEVWRTIPNAPKVVAWAPLTKRGDMLEWMLETLDSFPEMRFEYLGKPLALVTENEFFATDAGKFASLSRTHTMRTMRSYLFREGSDWSLLEPCARGFLASKGQARCRQRNAVLNGVVEQVSIAAAYQETYMSYKATAVPKLGGRTFVRQFETLFDAPGVPIATITGWNEWIAQRFCLAAPQVAIGRNCDERNDHFPDGSKVFVDQYDEEYNRDIEPSKTAAGSYYYRLMKNCIAKYRQGQRCDPADVPVEEP